eukprot:scaffold10715_cov66-Phaeocystis_antarctica.AAC.2
MLRVEAMRGARAARLLARASGNVRAHIAVVRIAHGRGVRLLAAARLGSRVLRRGTRVREAHILATVGLPALVRTAPGRGGHHALADVAAHVARARLERATRRGRQIGALGRAESLGQWCLLRQRCPRVEHRTRREIVDGPAQRQQTAATGEGDPPSPKGPLQLLIDRRQHRVLAARDAQHVILSGYNKSGVLDAHRDRCVGARALAPVLGAAHEALHLDIVVVGASARAFRAGELEHAGSHEVESPRLPRRAVSGRGTSLVSQRFMWLADGLAPFQLAIRSGRAGRARALLRRYRVASCYQRLLKGGHGHEECRHDQRQRPQQCWHLAPPTSDSCLLRPEPAGEKQGRQTGMK